MRASRPEKSASTLTIAALALLFVLAPGCTAPLPDSTSPSAQVYVRRCGNCHVPYNPHELTAAMWDMQVTMMEDKIQKAGMPPLTSDDRNAILDYLKRNAGTE